MPRYCGFNDVLCQIWVSHQYAQASGRKLWIDTRCSGLADTLAYYMQPQNVTGQSHINLRTEISNGEFGQLNYLNCYPNIPSGCLDQLGHYFISNAPPLRIKRSKFLGILSQIKYLFKPSIEQPHFRLCAFLQLRIYLKTHKVDFIGRNFKNESIVVHASVGGGLESLQTLALFRLNKCIRDQISERLKVLPEDYDAIHIRHTDYRTNYQVFIQGICAKLAGRTVLVCSDNPEAIDFAKKNLSHSKVITIATSDELSTDPVKSRPAHYHWHLPLDLRRQRNIAMLADLVGLSKSTRLFYTAVKNGEFVGQSGFSQLADGLRKSPSLLANWLGCDH
jgi:hypothetical protein